MTDIKFYCKSVNAIIRWRAEQVKQDLYVEGPVMSLTQLKDKFKLSGKHHFECLQRRSFICLQTKSTPEASLSTIEQLLVNHLQGCRGQRSILSKENPLPSSSLVTSSSFKHIVEEEEKSRLLAQTQTPNTRCSKLLHYNWLPRTDITPVAPL